MTLEEKIQLVRNELQSKFPECPHTIRILLWDDQTDLVEARYGDDTHTHSATYYNGELTFKSIEAISNIIKIDHKGTEYFVVERKA